MGKDSIVSGCHGIIFRDRNLNLHESEVCIRCLCRVLMEVVMSHSRTVCRTTEGRESDVIDDSG